MSRLEDISIAYRKANLAGNSKLYTANKPYTSGHDNAKSTGDEKGKGENDSGQVGSATDIKTRETLMIKNKFNKNHEYNDSNA